MLLSLDGYSSDCRPVRGCVIARRIGGTGDVAECPSHAAPPPSPGITNGGRCRTPGHARDDHLGCISSERSQQALHDGVLWRPELFGGVFGEATEDCQRRQPTFARIGIMRALNRHVERVFDS
jgi:hypothetical protein